MFIHLSRGKLERPIEFTVQKLHHLCSNREWPFLFFDLFPVKSQLDLHITLSRMIFLFTLRHSDWQSFQPFL